MPQPPIPSIRWSRVALLLLLLVGLSGAGWYAYARTKPSDQDDAQKALSTDSKHTAPQGITVDVMTPDVGGVQRVSTQPGTVEPFESDDVYAKVSGYLVSQTLERDGKVVTKDGKPVLVDIGTEVKAGDVLARISVPEYEKEVERDKAQVRDSQAKVKQMEAHLQAAKAEARAAEASVLLAKVEVKSKSAFRHYREKQLTRIKGLYAQNAVDAKLVDEQEDYFLAAEEAENAAKEKVNTAQEQANAAKAKIAQAEADLDETKALVGVDQAELEKSQVLLSYTIIHSPYTGVVTKRTFSPGESGRLGAFIKAADQGGSLPLFVVQRTDLMRIVVQVPDCDVPYLYVGAPATIRIDALTNRVFESNTEQKIIVARWAKAEDPVTRTMRTEIDVVNTDGKLQAGMYGRVSINLSDATKSKGLRIRSSALVGKAKNGHGSVHIVRNGKVHLVPVQYDADNGIDADVISGLSPNDAVILRSSGPIEEGTPVTVNSDVLASAAH